MQRLFLSGITDCAFQQRSICAFDIANEITVYLYQNFSLSEDFPHNDLHYDLGDMQQDFSANCGHERLGQEPLPSFIVAEASRRYKYGN